jgi:NADH-quinone oxidoreductase subunit L
MSQPVLTGLAFATLLTPLMSALAMALAPADQVRKSGVVVITMMTVSSLASVILLIYGGTDSWTVSVPWFKLNETELTAGVLINRLTRLMLFVVSTVSALVHLYSIKYMEGNGSYRRYFVMLGFFTFSMMGIVLADNLLLLFFFWEAVGFSSYMLIGHYMHLDTAGRAAKKAFVMNRVGDVAFLAGILMVWIETQSLGFDTGLHNGAGMTVASLCIFGGVMAKSAQFPLFTWLPDAMAGPTPVSALIHAATMVAAGVFLLARVLTMFSPFALDIVMVVGALTALMGGFAALFQFDIKRLLAFSTVSQLGFMMMGIATGDDSAGILHLFTHAFFKAGLFLAAGTLIHAASHASGPGGEPVDPQDIRNLGGHRRALPSTFITFLVCGASLAGIPMFSGFQSKEFVFSALLHWAGHQPTWRYGVVGLAFLVSLLTALYMLRLLWYLYGSRGRTSSLVSDVHDVPMAMRIPMLLLALGSLWYAVSWNPFSFDGWLAHYVGSHRWLTLFSVAWVLGAVAIGALLLSRGYNAPKAVRTITTNAYYLDKGTTWFVVAPAMAMSEALLWFDKRVLDGGLHLVAYTQLTLAHMIGWFDRVILDGLVNGLAAFTAFVGRLTRSLQGGNVQYYVFWALGLLWLLIFIFFS